MCVIKSLTHTNPEDIIAFSIKLNFKRCRQTHRRHKLRSVCHEIDVFLWFLSRVLELCILYTIAHSLSNK